MKKFLGIMLAVVLFVSCCRTERYTITYKTDKDNYNQTEFCDTYEFIDVEGYQNKLIFTYSSGTTKTVYYSSINFLEITDHGEPKPERKLKQDKKRNLNKKIF